MLMYKSGKIEEHFVTCGGLEKSWFKCPELRPDYNNNTYAMRQKYYIVQARIQRDQQLSV